MNQQLAAALSKRERNGLLRELYTPEESLIDFCSNDYLGFAKSEEFKQRWAVEVSKPDVAGLGSTGSRLLSGNHAYYQQIEDELSAFYKTEAALLFNSGYTANLSLLSCLPQTNDIVLFDEAIHNSTRTGLQLSRATSHPFQHNSCDELERLLTAFADPTRNVIVAVKSLYSMDGDFVLLRKFTELCRKYPRCYLVVDEAHSTGCYGTEGAGFVDELKLRNEIFCTVHTFGKGMGCHGAVVCGSALLKQYLINYARPLIYSTSLPLSSLAAIRAAHQLSTNANDLRHQLQENIKYFRARIVKTLGHKLKSSTVHQLSRVF